MQVKQADILSDLDKNFIGRLMTAGVKVSYDEGAVLFNQGDPAEQFYILVKGRVRLRIGENSKTSYIVNHGGEAFGWSVLTGRYIYSASAACIAPTKLLAFDRDRVEEILNEDPKSAALLYKNLALTLGNRLTLVSSHLGDHLADKENVSYGTGQVQEVAELV